MYYQDYYPNLRQKANKNFIRIYPMRYQVNNRVLHNKYHR